MKTILLLSCLFIQLSGFSQQVVFMPQALQTNETMDLQYCKFHEDNNYKHVSIRYNAYLERYEMVDFDYHLIKHYQYDKILCKWNVYCNDDLVFSYIWNDDVLGWKIEFYINETTKNINNTN